MMMLFTLLGLTAAYGALIFLGGRYRDPKFGDVKITGETRVLPVATDSLRIMTWNIGFAALGKDADFILDKGKNLRALSKPEIEQAARHIGERMANTPADVILVQEAAQAGFLTRNVPVNQIIQTALPSMRHTYWTDLAAPFAPPSLRVDHGMAIHSKRAARKATAVRLSPEPMIHYGFLKKYYAGLVQRFPIQGSGCEWVVINLHLSAFDPSPEGKVAQVAALFDLALAEHAKGNPVIIGGDWNMRMAETTFPSAPHLESEDWSYEFPTDLIPAGWQTITDPAIPTVRSMQQPFVAGENATMIIDGFIISPDVTAQDVVTTDLGFGPTDHHPVTAHFLCKT